MKLLGFILAACLVLAAIRAAAAALAIVLLIGLAWSAVTRPRETVGLFGMVIITSLILDHGLAFLCVVGFALLVGAIRQAPRDSEVEAPVRDNRRLLP